MWRIFSQTKLVGVAKLPKLLAISVQNPAGTYQNILQGKKPMLTETFTFLKQPLIRGNMRHFMVSVKTQSLLIERFGNKRIAKNIGYQHV
jgi:hypothetical protein